jgi:hypothetical protein
MIKKEKKAPSMNCSSPSNPSPATSAKKARSATVRPKPQGTDCFDSQPLVQGTDEGRGGRQQKDGQERQPEHGDQDDDRQQLEISAISGTHDRSDPGSGLRLDELADLAWIGQSAHHQFRRVTRGVDGDVAGIHETLEERLRHPDRAH